MHFCSILQCTNVELGREDFSYFVVGMWVVWFVRTGSVIDELEGEVSTLTPLKFEWAVNFVKKFGATTERVDGSG